MLLAAISCAAVATAQRDVPALLKNITMPPGFSISVYLSGIGSARSFSMSPSGILYVGTLNFLGGFDPGSPPSNVYAINTTTSPPTVYVVGRGLPIPNGVAYSARTKALYIGLNDKIVALRDIEDNLSNPPPPVDVVTLFNASLIVPDPLWHGWRYLVIPPHDPLSLYVAMGSPCNTPHDPIGTCGCILQYDNATCASEPSCIKCAAGSAPGPQQGVSGLYRIDLSKVPSPGGAAVPLAQCGVEIATGVRNSVGFTHHPVTHDLWFTDNGRDNWDPGHNDRPGDELNMLPAAATHRDVGAAPPHYGFPFCYADGLVDSDFNSAGRCDPAVFVPAARALGPHVASLGLRYRSVGGAGWPEEWADGMLIAEHGSWDRVPPNGGRITFVPTRPGARLDYRVFATGWLNQSWDNPTAAWWGRPSDVEWVGDTLLVADGWNDVIYQISYSAPN